jgi:23S rRNA (cytosine1962-C5)-methyltransferase
VKDIYLKPGRDKSGRQRHPWIFSGAIGKAAKGIEPGQIVRALDNKGAFVAYGYYNARSQIRIRLLEWNEQKSIDDNWWQAHIRESIERRSELASDNRTTAYRLVYGEADLLPGLIIDKYTDFVVIQILTAGIERIKGVIVPILNDTLSPRGIYERSDVETRSIEGLSETAGLLSGQPPPDLIEISENGLKYRVDIKSGQKTGFYLDQRDNRQAAAAFAGGREVLDCFSYTGGFAVNALAAGAKSVIMVDSSAQSLKLAKDNIKLNGLDLSNVEPLEGDVFKILREFRTNGRQFDMVILDPPKFAPTKSDLKRALSGYKDIHMLAMNLLRPNGILTTFSCSGAVDPQTLQTVLFWAAGDASRPVQILKSLSQGLDHPRLVSFPESEYLKGYICRVI